MAGSVIGNSLNYGYPGTYARSGDCIIGARPLKGANANFGDPVMLNTNNTYSVADANTTLALFAGVAAREVKQFTGSFTSQSNGAYVANQICDVIERGSVSVYCQWGTPASGNQVYLCVGNNATLGSTIGHFGATIDGTPANTIALTGVKWATGLLDGNNVTEICLTTRNNP